VGGPLPGTFFGQKVLFWPFSLISAKSELMGPKKFRGWVTPPRRESTPLKFFLAF